MFYDARLAKHGFFYINMKAEKAQRFSEGFGKVYTIPPRNPSVVGERKRLKIS